MLLQDISHRREAERRAQEHQLSLQHLATHDALTGLPNRTFLNEELPRLIDEAARRGDSLSILYIDCDNFKNINDSRGHSIGDDYLRSVARRLRDSIASPDLVVRMGGDEFLVVTRHYGLEPDSAAIAERVAAALEEAGAPGRSHLLRHHQHRPVRLSARRHDDERAAAFGRHRAVRSQGARPRQRADVRRRDEQARAHAPGARAGPAQRRESRRHRDPPAADRRHPQRPPGVVRSAGALERSAPRLGAAAGLHRSRRSVRSHRRARRVRVPQRRAADRRVAARGPQARAGGRERLRQAAQALQPARAPGGDRARIRHRARTRWKSSSPRASRCRIPSST